MAPSTVRRSLRIAALVTVMAFGAGCAVHAQVRGNFDDADTNHDGHVTLQEFQAYATARLAAASALGNASFGDMAANSRRRL